MAPETNLEDIDDAAPEAPKQLRAYAERQRKAAEEGAAAKRELGFSKAGIDTDSPMGQAFMLWFSGDPSDKEALLAAATEFNPAIVRGSEPVTPAAGEGAAADGTGEGAGDVTPAGPTGTAERTALADGAIPASAANEDVRANARAEALSAIAEGASVEVAGAHLVSRLSRGLAEGKIAPLKGTAAGSLDAMERARGGAVPAA